MGYTHYWEAVPFTTEQWDKLKPLVETVFKLAKAEKILLAAEYDRPGDEPYINDHEIMFNGVGDEGAETFLVGRGDTDFQYCKTYRRDYDTPVVAILYLCGHVNPEFTGTSDGEDEDLTDGLNMYKEALDTCK